MEWTKETLINTYILCTNAKQGDKVAKFYESFGFVLLPHCEKIKKGSLIGVNSISASGATANYFVSENLLKFADRIKLPSTPHRKFPREMMVSQNKIEWFRKEVFGKIKYEYPYVTKGIHWHLFGAWKYAKEI